MVVAVINNMTIEEAKDIIWKKITPVFEEAINEINKNYNLNFAIQPLNITTINDWNKQKEYSCLTNTMSIKDDMDIDTGIGIIFNIVEGREILFAPLGTKYINSFGYTIANNFEYLDINLTPKNEVAIGNVFRMLSFYITVKYKLTQNDKEVIYSILKRAYLKRPF